MSTFGVGRADSAEVNAECRTPTVGFALPVSLAVRPQGTPLLAAGRPDSGGGGGGQPSALSLTPSSRRAAADAQRGERLSNYRHSTIRRPASAGHENETETTRNDDDEWVENPDERPASPACSDDALEERSSSSPDDEEDGSTKLGSRCSLTDWNSASSSSNAIVQDGGQGPAQPGPYPAPGSGGGPRCHDYVNVGYLLSSRGGVAGAAARPDSGGLSTARGSPWVRGGAADVDRMAMSETDSTENLAAGSRAAWPSYGTDPLHRSDSFRSTSAGDARRPAMSSSSSLPRYGSLAQMWRDGDGTGPCLATFRLAAAATGQTAFGGGPSPRSSAAAAASPSSSSLFAHKSRLSASKDNNCMSSLISVLTIE